MKYLVFCASLLCFSFSCAFAANALEIHEAILAGDLPGVKEILAKDPTQLNVPDKTRNDKVPLLTAVGSGYKNIVGFLIDSGADVNMRHKGKGISPLEMATLIGNHSMTALLLEKGAKINGDENDPGPTTPLMNAIESGNYALVKFLVEKGADVNLKSKDDTIRFGWGDFFNHLVENGIDFNVDLKKGRTPLEVAKENRDRIINFLIEKGAK
ncbi:MAG: ankyrin repeat domain-containing protein [Candidatus Rifleibacteriota bacterium]